MIETTQEERDGARVSWDEHPSSERGDIWKRLLNDADRLAAIEQQVRALADEIVKALREAKAVRLMIAEQDNIEAYTDDLDDIISRLEALNG